MANDFDGDTITVTTGELRDDAADDDTANADNFDGDTITVTADDLRDDTIDDADDDTADVDNFDGDTITVTADDLRDDAIDDADDDTADVDNFDADTTTTAITPAVTPLTYDIAVNLDTNYTLPHKDALMEIGCKSRKTKDTWVWTAPIGVDIRHIYGMDPLILPEEVRQYVATIANMTGGD